MPSIKFSLTVETWAGMTPEQVREQFTQAAEAMIERMRIEQEYREQYRHDIEVSVENPSAGSGDFGLSRFGFYNANYGGPPAAIVTAIGDPTDTE